LKSKFLFRSLALTALAFFMLAFPALAESTSVNAAGAIISSTTRTLAPGESFDLSVLSFFPENMDEPLEWQVTGGDAVVSITETDGSKATTVTAINKGSATISLKGTSSLRQLAKCKVTVRTVRITSMAVSPNSLTIAPGRFSTLSLSVKPSSATYKTVRWTSSNPEVLSFSSASAQGEKVVDRGERVTVYAHPETEGEVTLSATAMNAKGEILRTTYRKVTVKKLSITKVTMPKTKTLYLEDPDTASWRLTATVLPLLASDELRSAVTYTSSKPEVAEIDPSTGVLTPKAPGGVTYVTASVGGKTSNRCKVTVTSKAIKSLSISTPGGAPVVLKEVGETAQLTANVSPTYAADRRVKWESGNTNVATVTEDGVVTAVAGGIAKITVKSEANQKVKATVTVRVRGEGMYRTVTITAAGDAVLGGDPRTKAAKNPRSDKEFELAIEKIGGKDKVFTDVARFFAGENNISTLNLEGTLTTKSSFNGTKPFVFRGKPEYAKMLRAHGIDTVCIANNHTYDVGTGGYRDTMRALNSERVKYYGNGITNYFRSDNGLKVAFLGFVSKETSASSVRSQVQSAAKRSDMVVVAFHWTGVREFRYANPTSWQKSLAHAAVSAGADLVLGHHVHRLNGIERYKGKYIVYDLGNFVTIAKNPLNVFRSDNPQGPFDYDSMIYKQEFHVWTDGFVEAGDITIIPCAITSDYENFVNNCQPTPYETLDDKKRVYERIRQHSPTDFNTYPINVPGLYED